MTTIRSRSGPAPQVKTGGGNISPAAQDILDAIIEVALQHSPPDCGIAINGALVGFQAMTMIDKFVVIGNQSGDEIDIGFSIPGSSFVISMLLSWLATPIGSGVVQP